MKKMMLMVPITLVMMGCTNSSTNNTNEAEGDSVKNEMTDIIEEGESDDSEELGVAMYQQDVMDASALPKTAKLVDNRGQLALYVDESGDANENNPDTYYTVWLIDENTNTMQRVCYTNPTSAAPWEEMSGEKADAVEVPLNLIATAEQAYFAPGKGTKILVEGCPDGRNIWTYIIDIDTYTAKMFPSNEGMSQMDFDNDEIILSTYGYYAEGGRYSFLRAYSPSGKYLRNVGEKEPE
jgi:hypothetical protein